VKRTDQEIHATGRSPDASEAYEELDIDETAEPSEHSLDASAYAQPRKFRIAVFASGSGSNFQAIVDAVKRRELDVEVALLVCDKPQAKVVQRAYAAGVAAFTFRPKEYASREDYEAEILRVLEEQEIDLVVLAGYMRLITRVLLGPYEGRIINIHPALLPAFPGVDGIGDAFRYGVKVTGVTVHYVDDGMDTGPIIAQEPVRIEPDDTLETLAAKIHAVEHRLYPQVIRQISEGRVRLEGRRVVFE
jgi:phosphoribosylglycinamide formyltransferase-1